MDIVQVSWDTEIFQSTEFYAEDGLEMVEHTALTLGRGSTQSLFIHNTVLKCMSL